MRLFLALCFLFGALAVHAQSISTTAPQPTNNTDKTGQFGLGLQVGGFSGIVGDYWDSPKSSWGIGLFKEFDNRGGYSGIQAGHTWIFPHTFGGIASEVAPYIGAGALLGLGQSSYYFSTHNEYSALAVQVPLGVEWLPAAQRFAVYAELIPSLEISPVGDTFFTADLGARLYY